MTNDTGQRAGRAGKGTTATASSGNADVGRASVVRPGWLVHSWTGDRIGTVADVTPDALVVLLNSVDAREVRVPLALVSGQDEAERLATLSVDASELDGAEPRTEQVDLLGRST